MAADIRLSSITIEPSPRTGEDPLTFWAECLNVGDEPTGDFIARFELDSAEWFEVPVGNIPPGEMAWAAWPHDALVSGDHFVRCILDAHATVPEPDERHNQQTQHFEVAALEFPPQAVDGDEYYDEVALFNDVISLAKGRVALWLGFAVQAVEEWETAASARVDAFDWDGDADVDFGSVLWALSTTVMACVPGGAGMALGIMQQGFDLIGTLYAYFGDGYLGEEGAKKRLAKAVVDLKGAAGPSIRASIAGHEERLRERLDPAAADNPLTWVEWGSNDPSYVAAICDWLGIVDPDEQNTTVPIKQGLDSSFQAVVEDVTKQLLREEGYDY
jgi:hypothetical protein